MGVNSIRSVLGKEDIISEIRLLLGAEPDSTMILVVEGPDDVHFFKGKTKPNVMIFESYSGKEGVYEIINYYVSNKRVLGICDKDYSDSSSQDHIYYYDYCCLEIMMIMSDSAFRQIWSEYYRGRMESNPLREKCVLDLKWLSLFRKLNSDNQWGVRFDGFSFPKAYNNGFDIPKSKAIIQRLNPTFDLSSQLEKLEEENCNEYSFAQMVDLTQGHDFIQYFQCVCNEHIRSKQPSESVLSSSLRCAFSIEYFRETNLYRSLKEYEQVNDVLILI